MVDITNLETQLAAKIAGLTGSETSQDLMLLKKSCEGTSVDTTDLDAAIQVHIDALGGASQTKDLLIANKAVTFSDDSALTAHNRVSAEAHGFINKGDRLYALSNGKIASKTGASSRLEDKFRSAESIFADTAPMRDFLDAEMQKTLMGKITTDPSSVLETLNTNVEGATAITTSASATTRHASTVDSFSGSTVSLTLKGVDHTGVHPISIDTGRSLTSAVMDTGSSMSTHILDGDSVIWTVVIHVEFSDDPGVTWAIPVIALVSVTGDTLHDYKVAAPISAIGLYVTTSYTKRLPNGLLIATLYLPTPRVYAPFYVDVTEKKVLTTPYGNVSPDGTHWELWDVLPDKTPFIRASIEKATDDFIVEMSEYVGYAAGTRVSYFVGSLNTLHVLTYGDYVTSRAEVGSNKYIATVYNKVTGTVSTCTSLLPLINTYTLVSVGDDIIIGANGPYTKTTNTSSNSTTVFFMYSKTHGLLEMPNYNSISSVHAGMVTDYSSIAATSSATHSAEDGEYTCSITLGSPYTFTVPFDITGLCTSVNAATTTNSNISNSLSLLRAGVSGYNTASAIHLPNGRFRIYGVLSSTVVGTLTNKSYVTTNFYVDLDPLNPSEVTTAHVVERNWHGLYDNSSRSYQPGVHVGIGPDGYPLCMVTGNMIGPAPESATIPNFGHGASYTIDIASSSKPYAQYGAGLTIAYNHATEEVGGVYSNVGGISLYDGGMYITPPPLTYVNNPGKHFNVGFAASMTNTASETSVDLDAILNIGNGENGFPAPVMDPTHRMVFIGVDKLGHFWFSTIMRRYNRTILVSVDLDGKTSRVFTPRSLDHALPYAGVNSIFDSYPYSADAYYKNWQTITPAIVGDDLVYCYTKAGGMSSAHRTANATLSLTPEAQNDGALVVPLDSIRLHAADDVIFPTRMLEAHTVNYKYHHERLGDPITIPESNEHSFCGASMLDLYASRNDIAITDSSIGYALSDARDGDTIDIVVDAPVIQGDVTSENSVHLRGVGDFVASRPFLRSSAELEKQYGALTFADYTIYHSNSSTDTVIEFEEKLEVRGHGVITALQCYRETTDSYSYDVPLLEVDGKLYKTLDGTFQTAYYTKWHYEAPIEFKEYFKLHMIVRPSTQQRGNLHYTLFET